MHTAVFSPKPGATLILMRIASTAANSREEVRQLLRKRHPECHIVEVTSRHSYRDADACWNKLAKMYGLRQLSPGFSDATKTPEMQCPNCLVIVGTWKRALECGACEYKGPFRPAPPPAGDFDGDECDQDKQQ